MKNRYRILQQIGEGATARVYLVEEQESGKRYAMKCSEKDVLLEREAKLLDTLDYAAFPKLQDYRRADIGYLVMEYVEGRSLQEIIDRGKTFTLEEVMYLMDELLQALQYLHLHVPSIIYRDLKPANIMIDRHGRVRLIDLGAACYYGVETSNKADCTLRAGTYGYAAPEQFWSGVIHDKACDIYAAGKVLAYLLSGKNPAEPPYDMEQYCKGLKRLPKAFMEVVKRCLAAEAVARYEDCESMRRAIHRAYEETMTKKIFKIRKKRVYTYKKCIWKSEYRRIF